MITKNNPITKATIGLSLTAALVALVSPSRATSSTSSSAPVMGGDAGPVAAISALPANPLLRQGVPDPSVLRVGRSYYMYATSNGTGDAMPIYRSGDLKNWRRVGQIFSEGQLPAWSRDDKPDEEDSGIYKFWGPDVRKIGGRYVAYYSTLDRHGFFSIGVATARRPTGPFRDRGRLFTNANFSLIDPSFFRDPRTGKKYLLWKDNTNALPESRPTRIVLHELSRNGLRPGPGRSHWLIRNDVGWEGKVVEAPTLVYRRGFYFLFYSGNNYGNESYAVGFARSGSVMGPYHKPGDLRGPILRSDERFSGPGGQSILRVRGQWLMFYHARERSSGSGARYLMLDRIWWDSNGLPHVNDGTPSG